METDELIVLQNRLEKLERKIIGKDNESSIKVSETLLEVNNRLSTSLTGRDKIKAVLKRVDDIERYLNPTIGEQMTLEDSLKMDLILTKEQYIRDTAANLGTVARLKPLLDSEHIKATPSYAAKLAHLNHIHLQQQEDAAQLSDEVSALVSSYNEMITTLSKMFVSWDYTVTKLESSLASKKK